MTRETLTVKVTRKYDASPERVFDAWLDPETARHWFFATDEGEMVRYEMDARVGGGFIFTDRREGEDAEHVGTYLVIDRPHRIVFTFAIPAFNPEPDRVTVEFAPLDRGCEVTLTHEMAAKYAEYESRTVAGWTKMLGSLAGELERHGG